MNLKSAAAPSIYTSITTAILAFGIDRAHKAFQVSADCISLGAAPCVEVFTSYTPFSVTGGWRGGEIFPVTGFFDYVLVWNTGISYGLLYGMPVWTLGLVMLAAPTVSIDEAVLRQTRYLADADGKVSPEEQKMIDAAKAVRSSLDSAETAIATVNAPAVKVERELVLA